MSAPPRILVLFGNVPLLGQERANIETLHSLRETGCAVRFLIRGEYTHETIQLELTRRGLEYVPVPFYDTLRHGVSLRVWWRNLVNICKGSLALLKQIRDFEATHIHVGSTANVINFLPALCLTRLPVIFRAGDLPPLHHAVWRCVWAFIRRRAGQFVCDSRFLADALTSLRVTRDRISVIYAPPPRREMSARLSGPSEPASLLTIAYVGQISHSKGVHLLIDAAIRTCQSRAEVRFLLAGDYQWNNSFADGLIAKVQVAGLAQRIVFVGFVEDIQSIYKEASLHLCPSLVEEGYGLTVLEAKVRGVPSVIFSSGALPELVTDGVDGLVCDEKTSESLQRAIGRYLATPAMLREHGIQARASLARLGIDEFSLKWRRVYDQSMKQTLGSPS